LLAVPVSLLLKLPGLFSVIFVIETMSSADSANSALFRDHGQRGDQPDGSVPAAA
jgi:hypothetical protein